MRSLKNYNTSVQHYIRSTFSKLIHQFLAGECSKVNPACDKGKCCENSKVVKTRSITFTAKTCVDKKYVNQTACTKICDDKTCGMYFQIKRKNTGHDFCICKEKQVVDY